MHAYALKYLPICYRNCVVDQGDNVDDENKPQTPELLSKITHRKNQFTNKEQLIICEVMSEDAVFRAMQMQFPFISGIRNYMRAIL